MARKEIAPEDMTAVIDQQEKLPYDLAPMKTVTKTLETGDYTILGLEDVVSIERKELSDFLGCCGSGRVRFEKEVERLRGFKCKAIIIEALWSDLERGEWRSEITPSAAIGSALGFLASGVPIIMGENRRISEILVKRLLFIAARRQWRMAQSFLNSLKIG